MFLDTFDQCLKKEQIDDKKYSNKYIRTNFFLYIIFWMCIFDMFNCNR